MKHCPKSQKLIASKCNQSTQLFTTGENPSVEKIVGTKIVGVLNRDSLFLWIFCSFGKDLCTQDTSNSYYCHSIVI